jgi:hypothetical protein
MKPIETLIGGAKFNFWSRTGSKVWLSLKFPANPLIRNQSRHSHKVEYGLRNAHISHTALHSNRHFHSLRPKVDTPSHTPSSTNKSS